MSPDVSWMDGVEDGGNFIVGFMRLDSDKSQTNMKSSGLTFYPFHVNLMNVSEQCGNYFVEHSKNGSCIPSRELLQA